MLLGYHFIWDFLNTNEMEARNIEYGTKVIVTDKNVTTPPASVAVNEGDEITILRADGMYCNGEDKNGNRIYIAAWTQVEPITNP